MTVFALTRAAAVAAPVAVGGAIVGTGTAGVIAPVLLTLAVVGTVVIGARALWRIVKDPRSVDLSRSDTTTVKANVGGEAGSTFKTIRNNDPARMDVEVDNGDVKVKGSAPANSPIASTIVRTIQEIATGPHGKFIPEDRAGTQGAV